MWPARPCTGKWDEAPILQFDRVNCAKGDKTFSWRDVTVFLATSSATYEPRATAMLDTWISDAHALGAQVVIYCTQPGHSHASARQGYLYAYDDLPDIGPGGCQRNQTHCMLVALNQLAWKAKHITTRYYLHVDDDTYVHPQRFVEAMQCLPRDALFQLGGCSLVGWERDSFCSGGPGYVLPTQLAAPILHNCSHWGDGRADDVLMSWCAREMGAAIINHPHMHYPRMATDPLYVTHHYISPEQAKNLHKARV